VYRLAKVIANDAQQPCLLPEISFSPDGAVFAVTSQENNELRLFDAATLALVRTWRNPAARFDHAHGVLLTANHIIVSNGHGQARPSRFNIYSRDSSSDEPIETFDSPTGDLIEAHTLAINGDLLATTYCEGSGRTGGLVSYRFDDATGRISGPLDIVEDCFRELGDPKALSFTADGTQVIVSFQSLRSLSWRERFGLRASRLRRTLAQSSLPALARKLRCRLSGSVEPVRLPLPILHNGLAVFDVGPGGQFSTEPVRVMPRDAFCRLENIHCVGTTCAISDTINHRVYLHDVAMDPLFQRPLEVVSEGLWLPHGVRLSPDKRLLVVTNFGLNMWKDNILWRDWSVPRRDQVLVFERA